MEIKPAILVKSLEELKDKLGKINNLVDSFHLDIADGIFVPNTTIGIGEFDQVEASAPPVGGWRIETEVHLMVSHPENHIPAWVQTKASAFIFHIESTENPREIISKLREAKKSVGVALNPKTSNDKIAEVVDLVDFVHFMTVEPGFYGSPFESSVLDKITDFHYFYPDKPIQADGGVNPETAPKLVQAGASVLVSGSYIFESDNIEEAVNVLKAF